MALADLQALIDAALRDEAHAIPPADRDQALELAVSRYSLDRPRRLIAELIGDGTATLDLPDGWDAEQSRAMAVEDPPGAVPAVFRDDFTLRQTPDGQRLDLGRALATGAAVWLHFSAPHQCDITADTIPRADREPVSSYAASLLLDGLAVRETAAGSPTIGADSVDHGSRGREYAARARTLRERYFHALGLSESRASAAGEVVNLDLANSQGQPRLFRREVGGTRD